MSAGAAVEPDEIYGPEDHKPPVKKSRLMMTTIETLPDDQRVVGGAIGGGLLGGAIGGPLGAAIGTIIGAMAGAAQEKDERRKREE